MEYWRGVGTSIARDNAGDLLERLIFEDEPRYVDDASPVPSPLRMAPSCLPRIDEPGLDKQALALASTPVHVTVSSPGGKAIRAGMTCHLQTVELPGGSFCELPGGVLATGPELTFLQMANEMTDIELACYGFELCGMYAIARGEQSGFASCPALTSVEKISRYLDCVASCHEAVGRMMPRGLARARRVLAWVADGAASPAEAKLCLLLVIPKRRGGYGLPAPKLNHKTALGAWARRDFGVDEYACDLSWPQQRVMAEYHGQVHKQRTRHARDVRKENILGALDYQVVVVEKDQLNSVEEMDLVAKALARGLGVRLRVTVDDFRTRQIRLRTELLGNRS